MRTNKNASRSSQAADRSSPRSCGLQKRPVALCVGVVPEPFWPSGADRWKAQDGCQNGQLWLGRPLRYSAIAYPGIIGKSVGASTWEARQRDLTTAHLSIIADFLRATNDEPRATSHYFFTSRGSLEMMYSI